jgi:hypothetical protein
MSSVEPKSETWCVHFTGVGDKTCKAGVAYKDMWDANRNLPCILASGAKKVCRHLLAPTQEQIDLYEKQISEMLAQFFGDMKSGTCPHCRKKLEWEKQIGRCVYGSCGCRLWQGKARTKAELAKTQSGE